MSGRPVVLIAGGGTGGHLTPALAIASELRRARPDLEPVLVGAERGIEAQVLKERDFRFHLLPIEPLYRRAWWRNARWPLVAARVRGSLRALFREERPVAAVGTGGYASVPAVWYAARQGIPTALQEQNAFPGLATRLLAKRVDHIYLGMPEGRDRLRPRQSAEVFITGNPIIPPDPDRIRTARQRFGLPDDRPVLLVTGGSQGALAINQAVGEWLETTAGLGWTVLWITGRTTHGQFRHLALPPTVQIFDFMDPMADAWAVADMVVARGGMLTVAELMAWGLPSLLIPLPTAAADHQSANARVLAAAGVAVMLSQAELQQQGLGAALNPILEDAALRRRLGEAAKQRGRPDAAAAIIRHLESLLPIAAPFANPGSFLH